MENNNKAGYCRPPENRRWKAGQSGNPKGRPKSRSEIVADAAAILSEPVAAKTSDGRQVRLDGIEAAYLALCKKGLKGHKTSLLDAIRIMFDVGIAEERKKQDDKERRKIFEDVGAKLGFLPLKDTDG